MLTAFFILIFSQIASSYGFIWNHSLEVRDTNHFHRKKVQLNRFVGMHTKVNDEDDGWGTSSSTTKKVKELEMLKSERESKLKNVKKSIQTRPNGNEERDLFIPIFAVVSLAGLFGAYGYEMLRLNAQGELYLPWK